LLIRIAVSGQPASVLKAKSRQIISRLCNNIFTSGPDQQTSVTSHFCLVLSWSETLLNLINGRTLSLAHILVRPYTLCNEYGQ